MKKQLAMMTLSTLVAVGGFAGIGYAATETIDFESIAVTTPASGIGNVLATITAEGDMQVVEEALGNGSILSYNSNVNGTNADGGQNWLPGANKRSLGNLSTNWSLTGQDLTITFNENIGVSSFSLDISDYGDWFPIGVSTDPREAALTAYDSVHNILDVATLSIIYNAAANDVWAAGLRNLAVSGAGIAYVKLAFADVDPGVTFDNFSFVYASDEAVPLCAGQDEVVGSVLVENDGTDFLTITYFTEGPWYLAETHLATDADPNGIPVTKKGNPIPGQFFNSADHDPLVQEFSYTVDAGDLCNSINIAAHAAVVGILEAAPYPAGSVMNFYQGTKNDGSPVDAIRSTPNQALSYETGQDASNFFSLGFDVDGDVDDESGYIIVEFDCPIVNGDGADLRIVEDTWDGFPGGTYPREEAQISGRLNETDEWTVLGYAYNSPKATVEHAFTDLDLGSLDSIKYVKIVDLTEPGPHSTAADAFDVNAILSLQNCTQPETAWGDGCDGTRFNPKTTWATKFLYDLTCQE